MLSGCGSKARTKMYKLAASYAIFASVGSFGAPPSLGRHSWNSVMGVASCQTASSSRPSITGGCVARVAVTLFAVAGAVESALRCRGAGSGDWMTSVTAARSGKPRNMTSPVVSWLDDGTLKKVVSGRHEMLPPLHDEMHGVSGQRDERDVFEIPQHRDDSVRSRRHAVPVKLGLRAAQVDDAGDAGRDRPIQRPRLDVEEEMVMRCTRPLLGGGCQLDAARRKRDLHRGSPHRVPVCGSGDGHGRLR